MQKIKKFICMVLALLVLVGNSLIAYYCIDAKLSVVNSSLTITNPIEKCIHPGEYYEYAVEINYLFSKDVKLAIKLGELSEIVGSMIYLVVLYDDYQSKPQLLNTFSGKWTSYKLSLKPQIKKVLLRFIVSKDLGNEGQNLNLDFITNLKMEF